MQSAINLSRRAILKSGAALVVAMGSTGASIRFVDAQPAPGPWPAALPLDGVDTFISVHADGSVIACGGHVDLGTGVRTAIGQMVAEELDVAFSQVKVVLGDTDRAPDQGPTIASSTIQGTAVPIRRAAAEARAALLERAAERLKVGVDELVVSEGVVSVRGGATRVSYGELIGDGKFARKLPGTARLKAAKSYTVVGQSLPRVDIPEKLTGAPAFVHDVRRPGMLHARVIRPPCVGAETPLGSLFVSLDETSVRDIPGLVKVVRIRDFVAVVAQREEQAIRAAAQLKVVWKPWDDMLPFSKLETVLREYPAVARTIHNVGDYGAAAAALPKAHAATYVWPYQMHGSIGPSCAVAEFEDGKLTVWSGSPYPHALRRNLVELLKMPIQSIRVLRLEAAGGFGRNCADDAGADAALLAREVGKPVRVQLSREQEHGWEPKGAAQLMQVSGGLNEAGEIGALDFRTKYLSGAGETLALYLTGVRPAEPARTTLGDRTTVVPYTVGNARVTIDDTIPPVRSAALRGVAAMPNVFGHESFLDELAATAKVDPVEFRLRYLKDPRAIAVLKAAAEKAGWQSRPAPAPASSSNVLTGRGVAYARYFHGTFPGTGSAWTAAIADVEVHRDSGAIRVRRVVLAHDCGLMVNPKGVRMQIHGNIIQSVSRVLFEEVKFDRSAVTTLDWASYPILKFPDVPEIELVLIERPEDPPLGVGEASSVPMGAVIANAIFDATGARMREVPFTPARVKAAMRGEPS